MARQLLVFVHGWGVTSTATYGQLPARLKHEASQRGGPPLEVRHIWLGEYVSFHDAIRIEDIAHAFDAALGEVLASYGADQRCVCITHSAGGPVVREWLDRYIVKPDKLGACPISHLIMLAPSNFGSALAQLGKSRLDTVRTWFEGMQPGQEVLDWVELGSPASCALNLRWIHEYPALKLTRRKRPIFPFVLTGDAIDRKLYDHVNPYTGENGSDGVVRVAAANLNARHVVLRQPSPERGEPMPSARKRVRTLELETTVQAASTAFKIVPGKSHSGTTMGIMASVRDDGKPDTTVTAILACLAVKNDDDYTALAARFAADNAEHQSIDNRLEIEQVPVLPDRTYIHDPCSMVIFRLFDSASLRVADVNLLLTAGPNDSPDELPRGFLIDRQANQQQPANLTFYLNHAALAGSPPIPYPDGGVARAARIPRPPYGLHIDPHHSGRFVEHWQAAMDTSMQQLLPLIQPNQTTLIDIYLSRIVHKNVFRFTTQLAPPVDFKHVKLDGVA